MAKRGGGGRKGNSKAVRAQYWPRSPGKSRPVAAQATPSNRGSKRSWEEANRRNPADLSVRPSGQQQDGADSFWRLGGSASKAYC